MIFSVHALSQNAGESKNHVDLKEEDLVENPTSQAQKKTVKHYVLVESEAICSASIVKCDAKISIFTASHCINKSATLKYSFKDQILNKKFEYSSNKFKRSGDLAWLELAPKDELALKAEKEGRILECFQGDTKNLDRALMMGYPQCYGAFAEQCSFRSCTNDSLDPSYGNSKSFGNHCYPYLLGGLSGGPILVFKKGASQFFFYGVASHHQTHLGNKKGPIGFLPKHLN